MLPMGGLDFASSSEDEAILDVQRDHGIHVEDTQPIVTVDQEQLSAEWTKRRQRIMFSVMVVSVLTGVGALAAVLYFVIHYLTRG